MRPIASHDSNSDVREPIGSIHLSDDERRHLPRQCDLTLFLESPAPVSSHKMEHTPTARSGDHIGMPIGIEVTRSQKIRRFRESNDSSFRPKWCNDGSPDRLPCADATARWPKGNRIASMKRQEAATWSSISAHQVRHPILVEIRRGQSHRSHQTAF
jgi:hypothetical protein